ncbi:endonuclease [Chitinimonas arctica]|uniref:Endonuclease n=1 Tax=Chitinimonas arctica TaxID=2594795 RepID=A0A516SCB9_9NEIS|nr:endonuclease [Chitinimonas arctica]QDQ25799.1 endonuclease [Chitinimonas arctica]
MPTYFLRYLAPLCAVILSACTDDTAQKLNDFAHSKGVKQIASLGEQLLQEQQQTSRQKPQDQAATSREPDSQAGRANLVTRRGQVGHRDFNHAKQVLPDIFRGSLKDEFYCGCQYKDKTVDFASCGYTPRKNAARASRIEWEHIVPAWNLGHQRQCWQNGGRKQCSDKDPVYQVAEGDLNNLVPAVGEVNGDRSNFPYGAWTRNPTPIYGQCQTVVDFKLKRAQPRAEVRGRIARVYFYMHERYALNLSKQDRQLMCAWAKTYPIDDWERERNGRIKAVQGKGNPYVEKPESLASQCPKQG